MGPTGVRGRLYRSTPREGSIPSGSTNFRVRTVKIGQGQIECKRPEAEAKVAAPFGPWSPGLSAEERKAQFRSLTALAAAFNGAVHPLVAALRDAERDEASAAHALDVLNALPALTRRRMLSVFGAAMWPPKPRGPRHGG
jgi:hypothetical protein